jgi:fluoride exporter
MAILHSELAAVLLVVIGGFLGGVARYWLSGVVARRIGQSFPWGTLAVNASGALAIGLLASIVSRPDDIVAGELVWIALAVGILGSYTTVSSFSLQTLALARDGQWYEAALNVIASVVVCLGMVLAGFLLAGRLTGW